MLENWYIFSTQPVCICFSTILLILTWFIHKMVLYAFFLLIGQYSCVLFSLADEACSQAKATQSVVLPDSLKPPNPDESDI